MQKQNSERGNDYLQGIVMEDEKAKGYIVLNS